MRVAANRRGRWAMASQVSRGEQEWHLMSGGVVEVVRLGRGEPLLLVPGLAGGWKLLAPLAEHLAQRFQVILYSLRGDRAPLGSTRATRIFTYAHDLQELIGRLRLERPNLFGVSFGGAVALELAAEHPELVKTLTLYGAEARFRANLGASIARRVLERFPLPSDNGFLNQFFNLLHGGKPQPGPLVDFIVERCWETDQCVMASRLAALESFDVSDRVWRIDVPTLVLAGSRDVVVTPARQRALAESIPGARFDQVEGAGHIGFLTHKADILRHLRQLLRDHRRSLC